MRTKNARAISREEHAWLQEVKQLPCSVCSAPGPSDAHHIRQGQHHLTVALCKDCHQGAINGWHGQKAIWRVRKMDEFDALAVTLQRLFHAR